MTAAPAALELRDYQHVAKEFLHGQPRSGLFLDMGLGKTAIALSALTPDHLPALVVAPKRVAEAVWPEERDLWRDDLSVVLAAGPAARRKAALRTPADVTVIGRDNIKDVLEIKRPPWRTVILDELSGFKSKGSVRWRAANRLIWGAQSSVENVWGLTGTPSPNGMGDLWAQVYLLDRGERLGKTLGAFRTRWFTPGRRLPNGIVASWDILPGAAEEIQEAIQDICLSMGTEGRVHLPPVTHNEITVRLPRNAVKAYADMLAEFVANLELIGGEIHTAKNAAVLTNKLAQVTAGFLYSDDYDLNGHHTLLHELKADAVQEIVEGSGSPVLVFYGFQQEVDVLRRALPQAVHINEKDSIKRWNRGEVPVLLAHPASAGHGLNLQHGGHTIAWTTLPWSLEEWEQANKRLARSGQKNPVVIHRIMATTPVGATVDHMKHDRLTGKASVQDALLAHLESPL